MSYYSEDDLRKGQIGGCYNMVLFEINRQEREKMRYEEERRRYEEQMAEEDRMLKEREEQEIREMREACGDMINRLNKIDNLFQELDNEYSSRLLNVISVIINYRRILRDLEINPAKTIVRYNEMQKSYGEPPMTLKEAETYVHQQIADYEQAEVQIRKEWIEYFKHEGMQVVEEMENDCKEILNSDRWFEIEEIVREAYDLARKIRMDLQRKTIELEIEAAGRKGEKEVEYVIKWLKAEGYKSIARDCLTKYGNAGIVLKNKDYIDETQEFDHIVVGKNGVFLIETKNHSGTIRINSAGDWVQEKEDAFKGIKNPVQQCDRHSKLMKSIIGDVPMTSIICIANDGVIITGRENCKVPIVRVELLQNFIEQTKAVRSLNNAEIEEILKKIGSHKVSEPLKYS